MKVYLLEVIGRDSGVTEHASVHSTMDKAFAYLAQWCRDSGVEQGHAKSLPTNDQMAIDRYFEFWDPESEYAVTEMTVDPEITL